MKFRDFTRDKLQVSALGFGAMRFPTYENNSEIDRDTAFSLLKEAHDLGINYFDTAYNYHGGNSELLVGEFFKKYDLRDDIYVASKCPVWLVDDPADFDKLLEEQLHKLQFDYLDFYLMHSLNRRTWENIKKHNVLDFIKQAKKIGKIKYAGFSFHDELHIFKDIVDSYEWDFCQIQFNYMDTDYQAGLEGLEYARNKGISVVVMEPVKGGKLANAPEYIQDLIADENLSAAGWALRYVLNQAGVSIALSGMSNREQLLDNVKTASNVDVGSLSNAQLETYDKIRAFYAEKIQVGCTNCKYCIPCPQGVSIPDIFTNYNDYYVYEDRGTVNRYQALLKSGEDATACIECGICESKCPQNLEIIKDLKSAHETLVKN